MHNKTDLPEGWKWVRLGDVADYLNGRAFKPNEWEEKGLPIIRIQNLNKPDASYNYSSQQFDHKYLVKKGDLLFAWSASLGAYLWKNDDAWLNQHIFKVVPKEIILKDYLYFLLTKLVAELYAKAHGSGMVHVTKRKFEATPIPLPTLPTQHAIVARIKALFSEIDQGVAAFRHARQQLERYRQSVLKAAFEGRLTEEWRRANPGLAAPAAVPAIKGEDLGELPEGWKWVRLETLLNQIFDGPFGSNLKTVDYTSEGVQVIRLENIGFLSFNEDKETFVSEEKYSTLTRHTVYEGDLIFSSFISENIRATVLPKLKYMAIAKADCFCLRSNPHLADKLYLNFILSSPQVHHTLLLETHGATRPRINTTQLKGLAVPLCSMAEQIEINRLINESFSPAAALAETLDHSLSQAEALKQSVLKQAFEGKLLRGADVYETLKVS